MLARNFRKNYFDLWKSRPKQIQKVKKRRIKTLEKKLEEVVEAQPEVAVVETETVPEPEQQQLNESFTTEEFVVMEEPQPLQLQPVAENHHDVEMSDDCSAIEYNQEENENVQNGETAPTSEAEDYDDDDDMSLLVEIPNPYEKPRKPKKPSPQKPTKKQKVSPIKILCCKHPGCKMKFTSAQLLEIHASRHVLIAATLARQRQQIREISRPPMPPPTTSPPKPHQVAVAPPPTLIIHSDDSDDETLIIDDDVELVLDEQSSAQHMPITNGIGTMSIKSENHQVLDKNLLCDICGEVFKRLSGLHAHRKISHSSGKKPPQTATRNVNGKRDAPETSSRSTDSIYAFKRYDTNRDNFICRICSNSYGNRSHLDRHVQTSHITKLHVCVICRKEITHCSEIMKHLHSQHDKLEIEALHSVITANFFVFSCPLCIFRSKNRQLVNEHVILEHYDEIEKGEQAVTNGDLSRESSPDLINNLLDPESFEKVELRVEELKAENAMRKCLNSKTNGALKHRCGKCKALFDSRNDIRSHKCVIKMKSEESLPAPNIDELSPISKKYFAHRVNGFHLCKCNKVFTNKDLFDKHHTLEHSVVQE